MMIINNFLSNQISFVHQMIMHPSFGAASLTAILLSFATYHCFHRMATKYFRLESLTKELVELKELNHTENEYYSLIIENLENTNNDVQAEAQTLRLSTLRLRNLYEKNPSYMTKSELERAISEIAPRLAAMRSMLKTLSAKTATVSATATATVRRNKQLKGLVSHQECPKCPECPICCTTVTSNKTMCSCTNPKCTYEWCRKCDKNIDERCPGCRGDLA